MSPLQFDCQQITLFNYLNVTDAELVPHFEQSDQSYMSYPGIREAYRVFDIETSFKPQATDG